MKIGAAILAVLATSAVDAFRPIERNAAMTADAPAMLAGDNSLQTRGGGFFDNTDDEEAEATKKAITMGAGVVAASLVAQQLAKMVSESQTPSKPVRKPTSTVVSVRKDSSKSSSSIASSTFWSVVLTATGLFAVLRASSLQDVKDFYVKLGLPKEIYGIPPVMYVAFAFVVFFSSVVTDIVDGGMSAAFKQSVRPSTTPSSSWYDSLKKPGWNPPGWVFPVMWLLVSKPTQFLALRHLFLVATGKAAKTAAKKAAKATTSPTSSPTASSAATSAAKAAAAIVGADPEWAAVAVYCIHLALGNAWNDVFFGFQDVSAALKVVFLFWVSLIGATVLFWQDTPMAGKLLLPTCAWVTVAMLLNLSIAGLNKDKKKR